MHGAAAPALELLVSLCSVYINLRWSYYIHLSRCALLSTSLHIEIGHFLVQYNL